MDKYVDYSQIVLYYFYNNLSFNKIIQFKHSHFTIVLIVKWNNYNSNISLFFINFYQQLNNHMEPEKNKATASDYLANERTFLTWVRTSIGIMAFGFVVVKFSLFVKQISILLGDKDAPEIPADQGHYSAIIGIVLVALGVVSILLSYIRYRVTTKQLEEGVYKHSSLHISLLTACIFLISVLLVYYLVVS